MRDLNRLYRDTPALHARDCEGEGFEWLIADDSAELGLRLAAQGAGRRPGGGDLELHAGAARSATACRCRMAGRWREILNTDAGIYGGSGMGNLGGVIAEAGPRAAAGADLTLPPLATIWLEFEPGA